MTAPSATSSRYRSGLRDRTIAFGRISNSSFGAGFLLNVLVLFSGCTTEGYSATCQAGGSGNPGDSGCFTPLGGSCLSHDEFVQNRPSDPEADPPQDPEADWEEYKKKRPRCDFEDE